LVALAGCGSSSAGLGNGDAGAGGTGGGTGAGAFITGDVDGVTVRGEMLARAYWFQGLVQGELALEAHTQEWDWYLVITNSTAGNACSSGYGQLIKAGTQTDGFASFKGGATCTVTVTHSAPNVGDVLEGTFSGTWLAIVGEGMKTITNGSFRVPRIVDGSPTP
jgi:hypothetical protein